MYVQQAEDGTLECVDAWILNQDDPRHALQQFVHNQQFETVEEIDTHDYRNLPDPEFRPDLNEALGGSLLLDGGEYVVPFRAPFGKVAEILEGSASDGELYVDYRPDFLELAPSDGLEKYQLAPGLEEKNKARGTKIVDEVLILDRGSEKVYDSFQVDALAGYHFIDQLSQVNGIDPSLAELLVNEYGNLRTVSWAISSDVSYLENTFDVDYHELFKALDDAGIYRNENSPAAGVLRFPERRADELTEARQVR